MHVTSSVRTSNKVCSFKSRTLSKTMGCITQWIIQLGIARNESGPVLTFRCLSICLKLCPVNEGRKKSKNRTQNSVWCMIRSSAPSCLCAWLSHTNANGIISSAVKSQKVAYRRSFKGCRQQKPGLYIVCLGRNCPPAHYLICPN